MCVVQSGVNPPLLNSTCGDKTRPCTSLQQCFDQPNQYTEVKIRGKLFVTGDTINITKSVNIVGESDPMIIGDNNLLFNVKDENVNISFLNIYFRRVRIANIQQENMGVISIINCTVVNTNDIIFLLGPNASGVSIILLKSNFTGIAGYVVRNKAGNAKGEGIVPVKVLVEGCTFYRSKGIYLHNNVTVMNVIIKDTVFKEGGSPIVDVQGNRSLMTWD